MASDSAIDLNVALVPAVVDNNQLEGDIPTEFPFDLNQVPEPEAEAIPHQPRKKRLSSEQRLHVLVWLLQKAIEGKLERGSINAAAQIFNVTRKSISTIWNTAKRQKEAGVPYNVSSKFQNCGRKRVQITEAQITELQMGDRTCLRDLATKLGISKTTVHRMVQRKQIKPHTNPLKPGLTDGNKMVRLEWILGLLQGDNAIDKSIYYNMFDFVHIDEKWFYLTKKSQRCYLASGERGQYRSATSSKWIPKAMFMGAVARPRFNDVGQCTFDGKIGIFPFTYREAAKRKSKYRSRGTVMTKIVENVNQNVTRAMLIKEIIPAIKEKWPRNGRHNIIFIQQDNAKAHIKQNDPIWQQIYQEEDFTFILFQQPPNSPDLNILDLGFFRSIQSLMHKKMPKDIDKMIEAVHDAFFELDPRTLSNVWMTFQYVMNEVLKDKGGNSYVLPHVNKNRMLRLGTMPLRVMAPRWAIRESWDLVQAYSHNAAVRAQQAVQARQQRRQRRSSVASTSRSIANQDINAASIQAWTEYENQQSRQEGRLALQGSNVASTSRSIANQDINAASIQAWTEYENQQSRQEGRLALQGSNVASTSRSIATRGINAANIQAEIEYASQQDNEIYSQPEFDQYTQPDSQQDIQEDNEQNMQDSQWIDDYEIMIE